MNFAEIMLYKQPRLNSNSCLKVLFSFIKEASLTRETKLLKEKLYMMIGNIAGEGVSMRDAIF
jgi:hypothetical protein